MTGNYICTLISLVLKQKKKLPITMHHYEVPRNSILNICTKWSSVLNALESKNFGQKNKLRKQLICPSAYI